MRIIKYLFVLIILIAGISFGLLNSERVHLNLYVGTYSMPLSLLLISWLLTGFFIGALAMLGQVFKQRHRAHQMKKRLKIIEQELENLRTMPVKNMSRE